eukprot:3941273-Rhodomonas_salina.7
MAVHVITTHVTQQCTFYTACDTQQCTLSPRTGYRSACYRAHTQTHTQTHTHTHHTAVHGITTKQCKLQQTEVTCTRSVRASTLRTCAHLSEIRQRTLVRYDSAR